MIALVDAFNQEILRDFPVIVKSSRTFISRSIDRTVRKNGEGVKRRINKRKRHSSYFESISKWRILSTLHIHWISIISLLSIYGEYNFTRLSKVVCTLNCDYFHSLPPVCAGPSPGPAVCTVPRASILLFKIWEIERSDSVENKVDIRYKVEIFSD